VADAGENRCNRRRNADGYEAVLDRSRPGFVSNEAREGTHAPVSDRHIRKHRSISQQLSVSVNGAFTSTKARRSRIHFDFYALICRAVAAVRKSFTYLVEIRGE
jgi:hypothetical protein